MDAPAHAHHVRVLRDCRTRQAGPRQFLTEYFTDYRQLLARLIERGIERRASRAIDAMATAITLTALFEGLALLFFVDPEATRWVEQVETSVRLLLSGLQHPAF